MTNIEFIRKLWIYIRNYRLRFLLSYSVLVIELISSHIMPLLIGNVVSASVYQADMGLFLIYSTLFAIVFFIQQGASFLQLQLWQKLNNKFVYEIRVKCYERVLRLKANKLTNINTGDIIRTINGDTVDFHHIIQKNIMRSFNAIIGTIFSIVMVMIIKIELAIVIVIVVPVAVVLSHKMNIMIKNLARESRRWEGKLNAWIWECLCGIQEIKLFAAEKNFVKVFSKQNDISIGISYRQEKQRFVYEQIISSVFFVSQIIFYVVSAIFVANQNMNIADYVKVASYYTLISSNLQRIFRDSVQYQSRKVSIEQVFELLDTDYENDSGLEELSVTEGIIEFKNISFSYGENGFVLKDFNGKVGAGKQIGIVGSSGEGKSTLGYILNRFNLPQKGKIFIDGQDLSRCKYSSVRKNIGIVSQEVVIFEGTIKYNICFDNDVEDKDIWSVLEKAYLAEDIRMLPDGIYTLIGQNGVDLSGGQRQRLVIARMLYRNPRIIVLDEATSALDVRTESIVQNAIDKLMEGKTSLIISHRVNSIINTDEIWIIKNGVRLLKGAFKELSNNNEFKELFKI